MPSRGEHSDISNWYFLSFSGNPSVRSSLPGLLHPEPGGFDRLAIRMAIIEAVPFRSTAFGSYENLSVAVVGLWIIGFIVTRLYFHPLSKFPGPRIAALTRWYEFYHDVLRDGTYVKYYPELHKKLGKNSPNTPLRVQPSLIFVTNSHERKNCAHRSKSCPCGRSRLLQRVRLKAFLIVR